jgi:predicted MFS family arabinose efflux permease
LSNTETESEQSESRAYSWYVLAVLFLVYLANFADRHLVAVLLEPMKRDLSASDTQMGLLTGIAFAAFYVVFGLPVALWADRGVRRSILALGVAAWSVFTMATGLGRSYGQVLIARVGVGVGESSAGAPVHSLLSDYFPPELRATALAIYTAGAQIGAMVGIMLGGWLSDVYGWRTTFFIFGAAGLPLSLLVRFTIAEPRRGRFDGPRQPPTSTLRDAIRHLRQKRSYLIILLADALLIAASYGASSWHPTFLRRVHSMSGADAGFWVGLVNGAAFVGGILCAVAADRLGRRDLRWYLWLPGLASLLAVPLTLAFPLWSDARTAVFLLAPWSFLTGSIQGPIYAMVQNVAPPEMRALAAAILLFVMSLIGLGLGPTLVGMASDAFTPRHGDDALRYALLLVAPAQLLGAVLCGVAARSLRGDVALAHA